MCYILNLFRSIIKHEQKYDQFTKTSSCLLEYNTKVLANDEADVNNQMSRKYKEENIRSYMKRFKVCFKSFATWIIKLHNFINICSRGIIQSVVVQYEQKSQKTLTPNRPGFSEPGTAGGGGGGGGITSLFEDQWPWNLVMLYCVKSSTSKW